LLSAGPIARRAGSIVRRAALFIVAIAIATAGSVALGPGTTIAASPTAGAPKVVIVVGPSGASTTLYLRRARSYATQARSYGARVTEIYTPNATWTRVAAAAQGANVLIYLGHGNGWPSPYAPFQGRTKNGLGLNLTPLSGNTKPTYYGEDQIATTLQLAPDAVVLLGHLCYASGNGEPGSPQPSWNTARQRVDNYAAGFLRAGASAVIADGHGGLTEELAYLFGPAKPLLAAWRADPGGNDNVRRFDSLRIPGAATYLDPNSAKAGFYRSLVTTSSSLSTASIFGTPLLANVAMAVIVRSRPGTTSTAIGKFSAASRLIVAGPFVRDAAGRTWAPVKTSTGRAGYVAAWLLKLTGVARTTTSVVLRSAPSVSSMSRGTIAKGTQVTVTGSRRDASLRVWLAVRTTGGKTGWMAAWLMRP
jgi:Bacterial SH3 domain